MVSELSMLPFDILERVVELSVMNVLYDKIYPREEPDPHVERALILRDFAQVNRGLREIALPHSLHGIRPSKSEFMSFAKERVHLGKYVRFLDLSRIYYYDGDIKPDGTDEPLPAFTSLVDLRIYPSLNNGLFDLRRLTCQSTLTSLLLSPSITSSETVSLPDLSQFSRFRHLQITVWSRLQHLPIVIDQGGFSALSNVTTLSLQDIYFKFFVLIASVPFTSLRSLSLSLCDEKGLNPWPLISRFISSHRSLSDVMLRCGPLSLRHIVDLMTCRSELGINAVATPRQIDEFSFEREYDERSNTWRVVSLVIELMNWPDPSVLPEMDCFHGISICNTVKSLKVDFYPDDTVQRDGSFMAYTETIARQCTKWKQLEHLTVYLTGHVGSRWGDSEERTLKNWEVLLDLGYMNSFEPPIDDGSDQPTVYTFEDAESRLSGTYSSDDLSNIMEELRTVHDLVYPVRRPEESRLMLSLWEIAHRPVVSKAVEAIALQCPTLKRFDWDISFKYDGSPCVWRWDIERRKGQKMKLHGRLFYHLMEHTSNHGVQEWEVGTRLVGRLLREVNGRWALGPFW